MTSEPNKLASFILYCLEKSLGKTCSARFCSHHQTSVPVKLASSKVDPESTALLNLALVRSALLNSTRSSTALVKSAPARGQKKVTQRPEGRRAKTSLYTTRTRDKISWWPGSSNSPQSSTASVKLAFGQRQSSVMIISSDACIQATN